MAIERNRAKCLHCFDVIESEHQHDFCTCSCGNLSVDGGLSYIKRCLENHQYKELSEFSGVKNEH